jgi:spermidine/putrescine transport system substrate-binding protein
MLYHDMKGYSMNRCIENISRRTLLKTSSLALASAAAGCVGGDTSGGGDFKPMNMTRDQFQTPSNVDYENQFNLWNWYTGFSKWVVKEIPNHFKKLDKVNHSGYASASEWYGRLTTGNHQMDNVSGKTVYTKQAMNNDYLSPLPVSEMPKWEEYINQHTKKFLQQYLSDEEGRIYAIPETEGMGPTLGYNADEFDEPPNSWDILWNEEYKGRITLPNTALECGFIGALHTGQDPFDPDDFKEIKEALIQQKPLNKTYWNEFSQAERMFSNKTVDVGACTRGALFDARFDNNAPHIQFTVSMEA